MNHVIATTGSRLYTTRMQDLAIKEQRAWRIDSITLHLARGRAAIDVALGEIFLRLGERDGLDELNYSSRKDYAVKARIAFKAAAVVDEAAVTVAAMEMTVKELKSFVNYDEEDLPSYRLLRWSMTPEQQDKLDAAVSLAKELEGCDAPEWKLQSRIASDYLKHDGAEGQATVEEVKGEKAEKKEAKDPVDEMTEKGDSACQVAPGLRPPLRGASPLLTEGLSRAHFFRGSEDPLRNRLRSTSPIPTPTQESAATRSASGNRDPGTPKPESQGGFLHSQGPDAGGRGLHRARRMRGEMPRQRHRGGQRPPKRCASRSAPCGHSETGARRSRA